MMTFLTEVMPGIFALGVLAVVCHLYGALNEVRGIITTNLGLKSWGEVRTQWRQMQEEEGG
jgi:hypothetical protein